MSCDNCLENCKFEPSKGHPDKGVTPINSIYYILTESCNLSCVYCFVEQKPKNMSYQVALDATKWLIAQCEATNSIPKTNFFGGEPLIMWDEIIVPLTNWVRKEYGKPFGLGITSNGVLLDRDKLEFMKNNDIGLLFSIDGPKDIQDRNRPLKNGGSSFDILAPKIPMILEYFPNMTFRSTFDHDDKDVMVKIHKFAIEQGYNNIFCIPNNLSTWSLDEMEHLQKQLHDLADYWMELFRQGKSFDFQPLSRAANEISRINQVTARNGRRDENRMPGYGKCGVGGTGFASVNWEGKLYSCQEMVGNHNSYAEKFHIGSIYTGVDDDKRVKMVNNFSSQNVKSEKDGRCKACLLDSICSGYCVMNNVIKSNGDMHTLPEISCLYYETAIKEMIRIMNTMAEEKNQTFKDFYSRSVKQRMS